jgi:hypothetical protein
VGLEAPAVRQSVLRRPFNIGMGPTLDSAVAAARSLAVDSHLSSEDLAALVDGTVDTRRRRKLDEHLALCPDCRAELIGASRAVDTAPRTRRRHVTWGTAIAAAAVIVIAIGFSMTRTTTRQSSAVDVTRGAAAPSATVTLTLPHDNADLAADSVRFVWQREPTASYEVIVTDSVGKRLFSIPRNDTTALPPATAHFVPGARYFWNVDAIRTDGTSLSSASRAFTIRNRP